MSWTIPNYLRGVDARQLPTMVLSRDVRAQALRRVAEIIVFNAQTGSLSRTSFCFLAEYLQSVDVEFGMYLHAIIITIGGGPRAYQQFLQTVWGRSISSWMVVAVPID